MSDVPKSNAGDGSAALQQTGMPTASREPKLGQLTVRSIELVEAELELLRKQRKRLENILNNPRIRPLDPDLSIQELVDAAKQAQDKL